MLPGQTATFSSSIVDFFLIPKYSNYTCVCLTDGTARIFSNHQPNPRPGFEPTSVEFHWPRTLRIELPRRSIFRRHNYFHFRRGIFFCCEERATKKREKILTESHFHSWRGERRKKLLICLFNVRFGVYSAAAAFIGNRQVGRKDDWSIGRTKLIDCTLIESTLV